MCTNLVSKFEELLADEEDVSLNTTNVREEEIRDHSARVGDDQMSCTGARGKHDRTQIESVFRHVQTDAKNL